jgi:hypothetical protein
MSQAHTPGNYAKYLDVPEDIRAKAKKFVEVKNAHTSRTIIRAYVESFDPGPFGTTVTLRGAILDSSDRHEGIVLQERWSVHQEWSIGGNIIYSCAEVAA